MNSDLSDFRLSNSPVVLIAARMSSQRMPGKALTPLNGEPLLAHVVSAVKAASNISGLAVVTSAEETDLPIVKWCDSNGVRHFRGSLNDVAERMLAAANCLDKESFVRVSGDSPLMDPRIIDVAAAIYMNHECDLVTNVHPRTFPPGQSVEVVRASTLRRCLDGGDVTESDREHVTPVLYRHIEHLRLRRLRVGEVGGDVDDGIPHTPLTVDTWEDLRRMQLVFDRLNGTPPWEAGWQRCTSLMWEVDMASRTSHGEQ